LSRHGALLCSAGADHERSSIEQSLCPALLAVSRSRDTTSPKQQATFTVCSHRPVRLLRSFPSPASP
jgi:hypothetical protein